HGNGGYRCHARQRAGGKSAQAGGTQQCGQPVPGSKQKQQRGAAKQQGGTAGLTDLTDQVAKQRGQGVAAAGHAKQMTYLAKRNQYRRGDDKAAYHRMRQKVGEKTQAQQAQQQQERATQQRQPQRGFERRQQGLAT